MSRSRSTASPPRTKRAAGTPAAAKLTDAAPVFAALGDATRLRLVARLCGDGPLSIAQLSEGAGVTRQAITKHLDALAGAGLVRDSRRGRERIWELEPRRLERARRSLEQISDQWDAAIGRLRRSSRGSPERRAVRRGTAVRPPIYRVGGAGISRPTTFIASAIIDPTSATLAGSTIVLPFFASSPNWVMYCSATRSWTAS